MRIPNARIRILLSFVFVAGGVGTLNSQSITITGPSRLGSFQTASYTVDVRNPTTTVKRNLLVVVKGSRLPLDFHALEVASSSGASGFGCGVLQPVAAAGSYAACVNLTLAAGGRLTLRLRGATTAVVSSSTGQLRAAAYRLPSLQRLMLDYLKVVRAEQDADMVVIQNLMVAMGNLSQS